MKKILKIIKVIFLIPFFIIVIPCFLFIYFKNINKIGWDELNLINEGKFINKDVFLKIFPVWKFHLFSFICWICLLYFIIY